MQLHPKTVVLLTFSLSEIQIIITFTASAITSKNFCSFTVLNPNYNNIYSLCDYLQKVSIETKKSVETWHFWQILTVCLDLDWELVNVITFLDRVFSLFFSLFLNHDSEEPFKCRQRPVGQTIFLNAVLQRCFCNLNWVSFISFWFFNLRHFFFFNRT